MSDDPKPRRPRRPSHLETEVDALDGLGDAAEPEEDGADAPPEEETSPEPGTAGAEGPEATDPDAGAETRDRETAETP